VNRCGQTSAACRGYLLVETLLALAMSAMLALSVLMMMTSTGVAVEKGMVLHDRAIELQAMSETLSRDVRCAKAIVYSDASCVALWIADADGDGSPTAAELVVYRWDAGKGSLDRYAASEGGGSGAAIESDTDVAGVLTESYANVLVPTAAISGLESCHMGRIDGDNGEQIGVSVSVKRQGSSAVSVATSIMRMAGSTDE